MFSGLPVLCLSHLNHNNSLEKYIDLFTIISDMASSLDCKLYKNSDKEQSKAFADYGVKELKE